MSRRPFLIITNGATGSGKSSLVRKTILHCQLEGDYTALLIDDLVENHETYKAGVQAFVSRYCDGKVEYCEALKNLLSSPDSDAHTAFEKLYWSVRGRDGSKHCRTSDGTLVTCDKRLDGELEAAVAQRRNLVFETTGTYYVDWLLQKTQEYDVYYAYSILEFCENQRRVQARFAENLQEFGLDPVGAPAPRLPKPGPQRFEHVLKLNSVLKTVLNKPKDARVRVLVFDNTPRQSSAQPLYDSSQTQEPLVGEIWKKIAKVQGLKPDVPSHLQRMPECGSCPYTYRELQKVGKQFRDPKLKLNLRKAKLWAQVRARLENSPALAPESQP